MKHLLKISLVLSGMVAMPCLAVDAAVGTTVDTTVDTAVKTDETVAAKPKLENAYQLNYTGKHKGMTVNEIMVKGQVFNNNTPVGYFETKTNEEGQFEIDKKYGDYVALQLHFVTGEKGSKVSCEGNAMPGTKEINLQCAPTSLHHYE